MRSPTSLWVLNIEPKELTSLLSWSSVKSGKCFICLIAFVLLLIVGCDSGDIAMCIDNDNCEDSCFVDSTSYNQLEDQIDSLKGEKLKPKGNGTDNKPRRKR